MARVYGYHAFEISSSPTANNICTNNYINVGVASHLNMQSGVNWESRYFHVASISVWKLSGNLTELLAPI